MDQAPQASFGEDSTPRALSRRAVLAGLGAAVTLPWLSSCSSSSTPKPTATVKQLVKIDNTTTTSSFAIALAKKYAGKTINWQVEAGTQGALWKSIKAKWESETGTTLNILEVPYAEQFQRAVAAHQSGGGIDGLYVQYNWLPDFVNGGVIAPLDSYFATYFTTDKLKAELADFVPSIRTVHTQWGGKHYGYPIDGPGFTLYYRKDIIEDPTNGKNFQAKYGYPLAAPTTWEQYRDISAFITDTMAPNVYGGVLMGLPAEAQFDFMQVFNNSKYGDVKYFDDGMKPLINGQAGVDSLKLLTSLYDSAPPGSKSWGPIEAWALFLKGGLGMTVTWPPLGRLAEGFGANNPLLNFVPPSTIVGKVGSALPPGGNMQDASGYSIGVFESSQVKDLAYAFITWATAPDVMVDLLADPAAFIRPVRTSSFNSSRLQNLFPGAAEHYKTLQAELAHVSPDLTIVSSQEYLVALGQGVNAGLTGTDPQKALDKVAAAWEKLTNQVGRDQQKVAYGEFQKNVALLKGN